MMASPSGIPQVSVRDLAQRLQHNEPAAQFVDVREADELEIAAIPGFIHLPLSESGSWSGRIEEILDRDREIFVLCHHGMRSQHMCQWLVAQGFPAVRNVVGGIDAYAMDVDRNLAQY